MWNHVEQALHDSMARVAMKVAQMLPGVLAFIVALLIFFILAWIFAALVRWILGAIRFDDRVGRGSGSFAELSPAHTPTILAGRVVFWALTAATERTRSEKISRPSSATRSSGPAGRRTTSPASRSSSRSPSRSR